MSEQSKAVAAAIKSPESQALIQQAKPIFNALALPMARLGLYDNTPFARRWRTGVLDMANSKELTENFSTNQLATAGMLCAMRHIVPIQDAYFVPFKKGKLTVVIKWQALQNMINSRIKGAWVGEPIIRREKDDYYHAMESTDDGRDCVRKFRWQPARGDRGEIDGVIVPYRRPNDRAVHYSEVSLEQVKAARDQSKAWLAGEKEDGGKGSAWHKNEEPMYRKVAMKHVMHLFDFSIADFGDVDGVEHWNDEFGDAGDDHIAQDAKPESRNTRDEAAEFFAKPGAAGEVVDVETRDVPADEPKEAAAPPSNDAGETEIKDGEGVDETF